MIDGYVEINIYNSDIEAEIARGMLTENGIEALIEKDDCGGMMPNLQMTHGVRLLVLPRDVETSRSLLKNLLRGDESIDGNTDQTLMWHCSNCGTVLEPQFTDCWKCGTKRELRQDV